MLTARPPFTAEVPAAVLHQHLNAAPSPPSRANPRVGPELDALVLQMLAKSPDERPRSAAEVRDRLRGAPAPAPPSGRGGRDGGHRAARPDRAHAFARALRGPATATRARRARRGSLGPLPDRHPGDRAGRAGRDPGAVGRRREFGVRQPEHLVLAPSVDSGHAQHPGLADADEASADHEHGHGDGDEAGEHVGHHARTAHHAGDDAYTRRRSAHPARPRRHAARSGQEGEAGCRWLTMVIRLTMNLH